MIELVNGDLLVADVEAIVNTVNCRGVMGKGLALQFKHAFPENYSAYTIACENNEVRPGEMFIVENHPSTHPRYIVNFPTKRHWRNKSRLEDIESGLKALLREVQERNITSIAIPPLGCGLGGLDWEVVRPMIEATFSKEDGVQVLLFKPRDTA